MLGLVHGQAAVINAAACVGHARCVSECPVGAVTLSQGDLQARRDVPVLTDELQAIDQDGLFLVGEITARSLIRGATEQGSAVATTIAQRVRNGGSARAAATSGVRRAGGDAAPAVGDEGHVGGDEVVHDAVVVGAGPGGLACALGLARPRARWSSTC